MILLDLSQTLLSSIMTQIGGKSQNLALDENLIRHIVLNNIRFINTKFKNTYGNLIICCDSKTGYWRRDVFPYYKANRKKNRDKSSFDWKKMFTIMDKIKLELKEFFPYKFLEISGAEADDIIAVLVKKFSSSYPILIVSGDQDFLQLQKYPNVFQYSPRDKKLIKTDNPNGFLREHILRGDSGDGVPNFMSKDDTFVNENLKQKTMTKKLLNKFLFLPEETLLSNTNPGFSAGYLRNKLLIDFDDIPKNFCENILKEFENVIPATKKHLFNFFIEKRLSNLMEHLDEF